MGRSPCCDKLGLKKGPWTPEEDQKLLAYIEEHGHGNWRALPAKAGLQRCGKSCRLRWTNYLRPDIKRGKFSLQEEQTIIQLHALLGNRWSAIATHLPKRTDNEIKNYWNTHLKKRLAKMGIDPVTHKPKNDALLSSDGPSKNAANLSHMAQWESARLEAEARLVRQSKLRSISLQNQLSSPDQVPQPSPTNAPPPPPPPPPPLPPSPRCLDVLKAWNSVWPRTSTSMEGGNSQTMGLGIESPTSTLSFSENGPVAATMATGGAAIEFMGSNSGSCDEEAGLIKQEREEDQWRGTFGNSPHLGVDYNDGIENSLSFTSLGIHDVTITMDDPNNDHVHGHHHGHDHGHAHHRPMAGFIEGFTELLLNNSPGRTFSDGNSGPESTGNGGGHDDNGGHASDYYEDNKNYWNNILNLVNSSPSDSAMF